MEKVKLIDEEIDNGWITSVTLIPMIIDNNRDLVDKEMYYFVRSYLYGNCDRKKGGKINYLGNRIIGKIFSDKVPEPIDNLKEMSLQFPNIQLYYQVYPCTRKITYSYYDLRGSDNIYYDKRPGKEYECYCFRGKTSKYITLTPEQKLVNRRKNLLRIKKKLGR